jgi:hypothetical protein
MDRVPNSRFQVSNSSFYQRFIRYIGRIIDIPTAIAGGIVMGIIVGLINRKFGLWPASTAALKQAAYTFFFGGMMTKLLYVIQGKFHGKYVSIVFSVVIVTTITVSLVYIVHNMKGTPMPFESTVPTAILAPFGFSFLAYRKQRSEVKGRRSDLRPQTSDPRPRNKENA